MKKNAAEVQKVVDEINAARMPKPSEKNVTPGPGEQTGNQIADWSGPKGKHFPVDGSLLGGVLQQSDVHAVYRAGDAAAEQAAGKGILGTAAERTKAGYHYIIDGAKRYAGKMFPTVSRLGKNSGGGGGAVCF